LSVRDRATARAEARAAIAEFERTDMPEAAGCSRDLAQPCGG
jgi:hypothetical protein